MLFEVLVDILHEPLVALGVEDLVVLEEVVVESFLGEEAGDGCSVKVFGGLVLFDAESEEVGLLCAVGMYGVVGHFCE